MMYEPCAVQTTCKNCKRFTFFELSLGDCEIENHVVKQQLFHTCPLCGYTYEEWYRRRGRMNITQCDRCGSQHNIKALIRFFTKDENKLYDLCGNCAMRFESFIRGEVKE